MSKPYHDIPERRNDFRQRDEQTNYGEGQQLTFGVSIDVRYQAALLVLVPCFKIAVNIIDFKTDYDGQRTSTHNTTASVVTRHVAPCFYRRRLKQTGKYDARVSGSEKTTVNWRWGEEPGRDSK